MPKLSPHRSAGLPLAFAFAAATIGVQLVDSGDAQAQGLLRRIRSRVQAVQPPAASPATQRPKPTGVQPQRVSPVAGTGRSNAGGTAIAPRPGQDRYGVSVLETEPEPADDAEKSSAIPVGAATFGVDVLERTGKVTGIEIAGFYAHSKADEAGLKVGDIVIAMNGLPTPTIEGLVRRISRLKPGQTVDLQIMRNGLLRELRIPLVAKTVTANRVPIGTTPELIQPQNDPAKPIKRPSSKPSAQDRNKTTSLAPEDLGATFSDANAKRGVTISQLRKNGPAALAGLRDGDRVVSMNGRFVKDTRGFAMELAGRDADAPVEMQIVRGSSFMEKVVSFDTNEQAIAAAGTADSEPASLLGGVGSFLGGFLGAPADASAKPNSDAKPKPRQDSKSNLKPSPQASASGLLPAPKIMSSILPGGIEQVGFAEVPVSTKPAAPSVPPSLEDAKPLPAPKLDAPDTTSDTSAESERIRQEIERLQKQLESLGD